MSEPPTAAAPKDAAPPAASSPLDGASQLVVVLSEGWDESAVRIAKFARQGDHWVREGGELGASIGHAGLGWGIGRHGDGAPAGLAGPIKREGDGRSPAGVFSIGRLLGYAASPPPGTKLAYSALDAEWRCVDDPASTHYNAVIPESAAASVDWKSAETMRRQDELYQWVLLVDHNRIRTEAAARGEAPSPGSGSCIFFHVGRAGGATVGCAALDRGDLEGLIAWLDPEDSPATIMLPRSVYAELVGRWQLPAM